MATATVKEVMTYFGMSAADFMKEWKKLTPEDKEQFKAGVGDGSLTY